MTSSPFSSAWSWFPRHVVFALLPQLAAASLPLVDFSSMGLVGLAGDFAGVGFFDGPSSVSFDPSTSTLLSRASDGLLTAVGSTNSGGSIAAGCAVDDLFYFGGVFSSIGGTAASNVAAYNPLNESFSALGSNGPNGQVNAVFCDVHSKLVWFGGKFSVPGDSVGVWNIGSNSWQPAPFTGLSGAQGQVQSITTNSSGASLFFAGSFITTFQDNNSTLVNTTNNPNVPFSAGATPFSSSLVPIPLQGDLIDASPSSTDIHFSNISNVLCPGGSDGPDNSWLAADGFAAVITVRGSTQLSANGIRLGNTFQENRSTTAFSLTTIPDNVVQTLTFVDPSTGASHTCSSPCTLLTDPSIPYQDFLFAGPQSVTGFQLTLSEWVGAGPGLHILQLLSSGAFVSAVASQNNASCFAPNPSNITLDGSWSERDVFTNISGTVQAVLSASVEVTTSSDLAPSITWMPYVSNSGFYNVSMLIPGCTQFQDCQSRTSVKVSTFPGNGLAPTVVTVSQQNTEDVSQIIYSGPIFPSSPNFAATVTMTLADQPIGSGQNGKYELIADRLNLLLLSVGNSTISGNGTGATVSSNGTQSGFGFFEWPLASQSNLNATAVLPQSAETALDRAASLLFTSIDAVASTGDSISAVAHHSSGSIFLAGNFTSTFGTNIIKFQDGLLTSLSAGGLNGQVTSLSLQEDILYVGGDFTDTVSSSTAGIHGIASYNVSSGQWVSLDGGVDGTVATISFINNQLLGVVGTFTSLLSNPGLPANGFAVWDTQNATWINSDGFIIGDLTFIGNSTTASDSTDQGQILAGSISTSLEVGSTGFVMLQNGQTGGDGAPNVIPLGVQLQALNQTSPLQSHQRRSGSLRSSWFDLLHSRLFARQTPIEPTSSPQSPYAPAPAVLAGAFWTNSSDSTNIVILGGNFSFQSPSSSTAQGVALYDSSSTSSTGLTGNPLSGVVLSLLVANDLLYIGGEFTVTNSNSEGFAIYDLSSQSLNMGSVGALQATSGSSIIIRSLTTSASQQNAIFVAGSFSGSGSVSCVGICRLDTSSSQWSQLGGGIKGDIASVAYAGDNENILVAAGSITLPDNTPANVAMFFFDNSSWIAVGDLSVLPGPVTTVTTDNGNSSSIFAAGKSSDGSSSFLSFYNGVSWNLLDSQFEPNTDITQVLIVPIQNTHSANNILEQDRMLLISGSLTSSSYGNASSVLYDGENYIPYIATASASGQAATVYSVFSSISNFSFNAQHFLAAGIVILISIAISAGVIFFLVLLGILWTLFARRETKIDPVEYDDDNSSQHRPSSLLEHINAATRTTILGSGVASPWDKHQGEKEEELAAASTAHGHDPFTANNDEYIRAETPSDAIAGFGAGVEEQSRPAHARYSFEGTGEGELPLRAGAELEVLDDRDHAWWYAREVTTGREGVVPASYLY